MPKLEEKKRTELVNQSKSNPRFKRRLKSKLPSNSSAYENIDMNKLFKEDILEVKINVIGETDTYQVIVSFQNVLDELQRMLQNKNIVINLSLIVRAVIRAFSKNDVYLNCTCPDFKYRFAYWATIDRYNAGDPEMRPTNKTNPDGDKGSVCKHGLLVLNKQIWIIKVASVINNYIKYMRLRNPKLYEKIIMPALYGKQGEPVEEPKRDERQISFFDTNAGKDETTLKTKDTNGDNMLNSEESNDEKNN